MSRRNRSKGSDWSLQKIVPSLFSLGGKLLFAAVVVIVVLTFAQCTVKKPEAPEWNTQFTVPLVSRTYLMPELIRKMDQSGVGFDIDSNVVFSVSHELDTIGLDAENLSTPDIDYTVSKAVGKVKIVKPVITPISVSLVNIAGLPVVYPTTVPASSFSVVADFPTIDDFTTAQIDTATVYVIVDNRLGFDIDAAIIQLFDQLHWSSLGSSALTDTLKNGEVDSLPFVLDGHTVSNTLNATISCHTPGGYLQDANGKVILVAAHFANDPVVSSATAQIPALQRVLSDSVSLQESDVITDAAITAGSADLVISNSTPITATLQVTIPDLQLSGTPLTVSRQVNAYGSVNVHIPLAGYAMRPSDLTAPQYLPVTIEADVPATTPNQVSINETQNFQAAVSLTGLQFGAVSGYFSSTVATLDPIVQDIDIPKGFDSIQFTSAVLTLEIDNAVALPGRLDISMAGDNGQTLPVAGDIAARILATAATTELVQPNVATFFTPVPSQVTITGTASFGDGQFGTIRAGDFLTGRVRIESPLEVIIPETPLETDVADETIEQKDIDKITDHVLNARFIYNVTNHLPVGATLNVVISPDSATLFTNPQLRFDDISINAAPVTAGIVTDTLSTGFQTIALDSADVQILKNPKLYIAQEMILHSSAGQAVRLTKNDYISINGRIEVEYRFDGNL
ncbi:hypothetical protein C3F09_00400 [candidate division GN15 bacterium]|uniref:Uncharacterized protein n=1 Tax=candidate division GN15 bacterium TaxID=2072418 RepID=A0A855XE27_9BACT|nr:MAG: hypothetical protein C3F09_00400 [candidate division GN15 bacterium]